MNTYSFKKTFWKMVKYFIIFIIPFLVDQFIVAYPEIAQISIGALLVGIVNWGKNWAGLRWL